MLVSLGSPSGTSPPIVPGPPSSHPREWLAELRGLRCGDRRLLTAPELERARVRADEAHARLGVSCRASRPHGRAAVAHAPGLLPRRLESPSVDGLHEPQALAFERNGEAMLAPLEGDVMRWTDGYVEHRGRLLRIESELGISWQAQLVAGGIARARRFPGARRS